MDQEEKQPMQFLDCSKTVLYVLKLSYGKYYIGKTSNINARIIAHSSGMGSWWSKKYLPIIEHTVMYNADIYDEDKYTIMYMDKYGIDNVRGGSFSKIKLSNSDKHVIKKMISNATDRCFICDKEGHFASNCPVPRPHRVFKGKRYQSVGQSDTPCCQKCIIL